MSGSRLGTKKGKINKLMSLKTRVVNDTMSLILGNI